MENLNQIIKQFPEVGATAISCVKQVRDTRVHQRVYLLHTALNRVIMKVDPVHAGRRGITRYRRDPDIFQVRR